jgi:hypothetical protein
LKDYFELPLTEVAKKFNMCSTKFKMFCRQQGIMKWPFRALRSLGKKQAVLQVAKKFDMQDVQIDEELEFLQVRPCEDRISRGLQNCSNLLILLLLLSLLSNLDTSATMATTRTRSNTNSKLRRPGAMQSWRRCRRPSHSNAACSSFLVTPSENTSRVHPWSS